MDKCKCCDGVLHPSQVVSVYAGCGLVRMIVLNEARQEIIYLDNVINYCPMCGRKL